MAGQSNFYRSDSGAPLALAPGGLLLIFGFFGALTGPVKKWNLMGFSNI
jgi:hypothetical protein